MEDTKRSILSDTYIPEENFESGSLSPVADQLVAIAEKLRTSGLTDELSKIAAQGRREAAVGVSPNEGRTPSTPSELASHRREYADMARRAYEVRRTRGTIFGDPDLFGEPAWDILLDLYVAHVDDKPVSVSSACIGSAAPPTTGLRWLGVLAEQNLVKREQDPEDQRRVLVRLTDTGLAAMDRYFADTIKRGSNT